MNHARLTNLLGALGTALADAQLAEAEAASGLGSSAIAALIAINYGGDGGINGLTLPLGLSHSASVRVVEDLVRTGLVSRGRGQDRRQAKLSLTQQGEEMRERILEARRALLQNALATIDPSALPGFETAISAILVHLTTGRETADHLCRFCDEIVCPAESCPVECEARRRAGELT
jgi:DNA-binding MarR family transcriptional regulator